MINHRQLRLNTLLKVYYNKYYRKLKPATPRKCPLLSQLIKFYSIGSFALSLILMILPDTKLRSTARILKVIKYLICKSLYKLKELRASDLALTIFLMIMKSQKIILPLQLTPKLAQPPGSPSISFYVLD